ncbi:hypothetical protein HMN09_00972000 [Mycena chlorophos]|uniref:F-box domain-containing protein n=1 Tax=Mycena chlorophos TaxID=658473 RepID=A0A8H6SJ95_MYCCL|nr:hypothetical protein HMN09_00972000 [Mycena chlorophos]
MSLPQELHDYIIDFLHLQRQSLCSCSLVCKAWLPSSRYHLFTHSTVRVHRNNLNSFLEMHGSGVLNPYIGRLDLESHVIDDRWRPDEPAFLFNEDLSRFTGLPALRYLRIHYHHEDIAPSFAAAISHNFSQLTELEFSSVQFPTFASVLAICQTLPFLRRLALSQLSLHQEEPDAPLPTLPHLTMLVFNNYVRSDNIQILKWIAGHPGLRSLALSTRLFIPDELEDQPLASLWPRLQHLILGHSTSIPDLSGAIKLHTLELRAIPLASRLNFQHNKPSDVPDILTAIFGNPQTKLECVVLSMYLDEPGEIEVVQWERVASLLRGARSLRHVKIKLSAHKKALKRVILEEKLPPPRAYSLRVENLVPALEILSLVNCAE